MESSGHSLMEAELPQEKSEALILDEDNTDGSETACELDGCGSQECKNDTLLKEEKSSEDEEEDFKQLIGPPSLVPV